MKKHTPSLPKEFSLSSYDECMNWTAKDWYKALITRSDLFFNEDYTDMYWEECDINRSMTILQLMKQPMGIDISDNLETFKPDWTPLYDQSIEDFFLSHVLVENYPSYRELYDSLQKNRDELGRYNNPQNQSQYKKYIESLTPAWQVHQKLNLPDREGEIITQFTITVDLTAPDYLLKALFENWLRMARKNTQITNAEANFDQTKFIKWHKKRLLPYLDLKAWAKLADVQIPNRTYCDVLFADDLSGKSESDIKRTVDKNAMELMSLDLIFALQCEAYRAHVVRNFEAK